jgi:hypothetical protein
MVVCADLQADEVRETHGEHQDKAARSHLLQLSSWCESEAEALLRSSAVANPGVVRLDAGLMVCLPVAGKFSKVGGPVHLLPFAVRQCVNNSAIGFSLVNAARFLFKIFIKLLSICQCK